MEQNRKEREISTFYWGHANIQTFLYGTELTQEAKDHIHFLNPLMPAGTPIHEWYSYTNYQLNRDVPRLPFLYEGRTYRIEPNIQTVPKDSFLLEILYFDRGEQLLESKVLYPPEYLFEYPEDCYYYTIRLSNGGCDELTFHSFVLMEVENES